MGSKTVRTVPFERYSLTLKHEIIDEDGKVHMLDEPLVISGIISSFEVNAMICPVNAMIHSLFERMEHEVMQKFGEI